MQLLCTSPTSSGPGRELFGRQRIRHGALIAVLTVVAGSRQKHPLGAFILEERISDLGRCTFHVELAGEVSPAHNHTYQWRPPIQQAGGNPPPGPTVSHPFPAPKRPFWDKRTMC